MSRARWFVTGQDYFPAVKEALERATKEVFIADWWLSPELHLTRPVTLIEGENRLDLILETIAKKGVKVYIIVYQEVRLALSNDSIHTKKHLEELSPNI